MILLAVGQIVLRIFFSIGFVWADELVSLTVLWVAIVASVAAARSDRHLRIDALSHFVSKKYARISTNNRRHLCLGHVLCPGLACVPLYTTY